ncbi:MAG: hypothetical protein ACE5JK_02315 [Candidatus Omnitrophota bacterium]
MRKCFIFFLLVIIGVAIISLATYMTFIHEKVDEFLYEGVSCPVSRRSKCGKGMKVIVTYKEQKYALCCVACKSLFENDPEGFLASPGRSKIKIYRETEKALPGRRLLKFVPGTYIKHKGHEHEH